jgi:hypothetical protein
MDHPDWYPDWRHDAFHQLQDKNARVENEYRVGHWPRWDYDLATGKLVFSEDGVAKVIADIQVAGTTSEAAGNWLWAWANDHWPAAMVEDSLSVRAFGVQHGICDLAHDYVEGDNLNGIGWELTAAAARVTDAVGAYRPPHDGGAMFLIFRSICWAS